jgi:LDH2 family malate/lactate/ureidoglycolate dehydrogenase
VVDVASFQDRGVFTSRVDAIIDQIHASTRPAAGSAERLRVPGELAAKRAERCRQEGVPLSPATCDQLRAWATRLGVRSPLDGARSREERQG